MYSYKEYRQLWEAAESMAQKKQGLCVLDLIQPIYFVVLRVFFALNLCSVPNLRKSIAKMPADISHCKSADSQITEISVPDVFPVASYSGDPLSLSLYVIYNCSR